MKSKKHIYIYIGILVLVFLVIFVAWFGVNFAPGSYPYAQRYLLEYSEKEIKEAIRVFKNENPKYMLPKMKMQLSDGQSEEGHWYYVYFYNPDEDKVLFTWTRPVKKDRTVFAFVAMNDGVHLGNWKDINGELPFEENERAKRQFEEKILYRIEEIVNRSTKSD